MINEINNIFISISINEYACVYSYIIIIIIIIITIIGITRKKKVLLSFFYMILCFYGLVVVKLMNKYSIAFSFLILFLNIYSFLHSLFYS
jgi:hypothetical protein